MAQLRQQYDKFQNQRAEVVVIGPDKADSFRKYWNAHQLPFVGLPDPEHRILDLYGQEFKVLKLGRLPAQAIVDQEGMIRFVHYGHDMTDIPANEELLTLLAGLNQGANADR